MQKVILERDPVTGNCFDSTGTMVGFLNADNMVIATESTTADVTLQLVKQGVTVDEIIKLKNAELL